MDLNRDAWLPITRKDVEKRGWDELDVIIISGDAYVDHPSFGSAVIARIIEAEGYRVAIVPQPDWRSDDRDFTKLGVPRLFFAVTAGTMDSMVNHYTANKRKRSNDAYSAGGKPNLRPDYATEVYTKILKKHFPNVPVVIGGVEASLRRVTHYDYWSDQLRPSMLLTSEADLLVYGMGEQPLREILRLLQKGVPFKNLNTIPQTAFIASARSMIPENKKWIDEELASHEVCLQHKKRFAANFKRIEIESNKTHAKRLIQEQNTGYLVINPPFQTMTEKEIDASFDLPYTRLPHPKYNKQGSIPAYEMIRFSLNTHRGCFGGCSFCTISAHQGKFIASRSEESILKELDEITKLPGFKGYVSDMGGPSANMYKMKGIDQSICDACQSPSCIHPVVCSNLDTSHQSMIELYQKVRSHEKVKKAFVSSGIRYDLLVKEYNKRGDETMKSYMEEVMKYHVSGRLKVAPEHTSDHTLRIMRKPSFRFFHRFKEQFDQLNKSLGLKLQLIPYFISSHPESQLEDMADLAAETKEMGFKLEQVQGFTPTPMTVATVMYYSGYDPYTLKKVYTPRTEKERNNQHRFFFWYKKENQSWIKSTLLKRNRADLVDALLGKN
jgi:uncharacterized radical SAM protein YgiQ